METTVSGPTAVPIRLRPLSAEEDLGALRVLEAGYAGRTGAPPLVAAAALRHFERGGHAFVASRGTGAAARGMALAHAAWDGARPVVRLVRLVAEGDDRAMLGRLVAAVVRSAYDAAVYDLVAEIPEADEAGQQALLTHAFADRPVRRFERQLGSRAGSGA
jgi:hypothetical protein